MRSGSPVEKVNKKLRSRRGVSIGELLFVVLLLGLVSTGLAAGVRLAMKQFTHSMQGSSSHVLCSSLSAAISNELRYTNTVETDASGNVTGFYSPNYHIESGLGQILTLNAAGEVTGDYGQITLGSTSEHYPLLAASAYNYDLGAKVTQLSYDEQRHVFHMTLEVADITSKTVYAREELDIRNANKCDK